MTTPPGPQDPYGAQPPAGGMPPNYYGGAPQQPGPPPQNYLVWAIISVFLCWPLAIPAIIFSTQVNTKWAQGDAMGAQESSRKAKTFALWATIAGAVSIVLWFALSAAGILAAGSIDSTY